MTYTRFHNCKAEGCTQVVALHLLMCIEHWRLVPAATRRAVLSAWRRWKSGVKGAWADYQAAVADAVAAVREKEIKRSIRQQQHGDNLDLQ